MFTQDCTCTTSIYLSRVYVDKMSPDLNVNQPKMQIESMQTIKCLLFAKRKMDF